MLDYVYFLWRYLTTTCCPSSPYHLLGGELTEDKQDSFTSILVSSVGARLLGGALVDRKEKDWA